MTKLEIGNYETEKNTLQIKANGISSIALEILINILFKFGINFSENETRRNANTKSIEIFIWAFL